MNDINQILASTAQLNAVLLQTSEEEYDNVATQGVIALKKLPSPDASTALQLLQTIDPSAQTIPYVLVLSSLTEASISSKPTRTIPPPLLPEGQLWPLITAALTTFDRIQARYVGPQLVRLVEIVYHGADQTGNYVPAIQLLQHVILTLDPTSSTLSLTHCYYVRLCLLAKMYFEAQVILNYPLYHVPSSESTKASEKRLGKYFCSQQESNSMSYINTQTGLSGKLSTRIVMEYFFYGALCYIATRQWKRAQTFLEVVLVFPTLQNAASLIMLDAYRKYILIGLILDGNTPSPPKAMNSNAVKHIRTIAKPYECVAETFKLGFDRFVAEVNEGTEQWQEDCNYGLMVELLSAWKKFHVRRLGKTYAALPTNDPAWQVSKEAQSTQDILVFVQSLIDAGEIQAQIVPSQIGAESIVRFLPPTAAQKSEAEVQHELARKAVELQVLLKHVSDYDHQIEVNKDSVEWLVKAKKARDSDKKAGTTTGQDYPIGRPPPPDWQDEAMMEDW